MVNKGLENLYGTDGITPPKEVNSSKRGEPFLILHLDNAWGGLPIVSEPDPRKEGRLRWKCTMCLDASVLPIGLRLLCAFIGKKKPIGCVHSQYGHSSSRGLCNGLRSTSPVSTAGRFPRGRPPKRTPDTATSSPLYLAFLNDVLQLMIVHAH